MKTSIDLIAPASAATAGDRECALQVMRAVRDLDAATRNLDIVEGLRLAHAAGDIVAAHCAAATAKERQARELAEGENARLVAALLFCDSFADQCETAEDRSNLDGDSAEAVLLQINEAAFEARAKIAQALAPAPAGGKPE